jgi:hypothetical protein
MTRVEAAPVSTRPGFFSAEASSPPICLPHFRTTRARLLGPRLRSSAAHPRPATSKSANHPTRCTFDGENPPTPVPRRPPANWPRPDAPAGRLGAF